MTWGKDKGSGAKARPSAMSLGGDGAEDSANGRRGPAVIAMIHGEHGDRELRVSGRQGWALRQLVDAGSVGVSTLERPALRWSSYIHRLRDKGVLISTELEEHGGAFPGRHGRYRLLSKVSIRSPEAVV